MLHYKSNITRKTYRKHGNILRLDSPNPCLSWRRYSGLLYEKPSSKQEANNLMKGKIISIGAVVFLVLLATVLAADIEGNWIVKMPLVLPTPGRVADIDANWIARMPVEIVFYFSVDGTKLTGTVTDHQGKAAIQDGKMNGDAISFFVIRNSSGRDVKMVYSGKVAKNEIEFSWTAPGVGMSPQKLIAKREFLRDNDYIPRRISTPVKPLIR
jgi:hypothetical protein